MNRFIKFNTESVYYSIINPNETKTFFDSVSPYSFPDFLKYTKENYSPVQYNDFYLFYLEEWTRVKQLKEDDKTIFVKEQYKGLLQDIALNYTTNEEKRFLANIDYDDPEDLEIVVPFYSSKIREIILYYKSLRDKIELNTFNFKQKGTLTNIRKVIGENTLDYLFNDKPERPLTVPLEETLKSIDVYFEELVDTFGGYFNLGEDPADNESDLRKLYYTANYNNVDPNLFINFNTALVNVIFNKVFLRALGSNFTINAGQVYDPFCNPDNPLARLIKSKTVNNISPSSKLLLQQQLLQKYLGVDLYYLTRSTEVDFLSGVLVQASNPSNNFLNVTNPSVAVVPSNQLIALRKLGLYFSPDKVGILKFDVRNKKVFINPQAAEIGKTYVFPDPEVYGNIQYPTDEIVPVTYAFNYEPDIKGISSTFIYGDPKIETRDQPFYGYFSNQQIQDFNNIDYRGIEVNLAKAANKGYVYSWKTDIYGNQYGLFKSGYKKGIVEKADLVDFEAAGIFNRSFLNKTLSSSKTTYSSTVSTDSFINVYDKSKDVGSIYVKNAYTNQLDPLSTALASTFTKYSSAVKAEIYNSVEQFDLFYDTIVIQTPNYVVFDGVKLGPKGTFTTSSRTNTYVSVNSSSNFSKISNRIFVEQENKIYFYKVEPLQTFENDYSKVIVPYLYTYDLVSKKIEQIFPIPSELPSLTSYFSHRVFRAGENNEGIGVNLVNLDTPKLSYNSYNNVFHITYICKDLNNAPYIFNYTMKKTFSNVTILSGEVFDNLGFDGIGDAERENQTYIQFFKKTLNYYSVSATEALVSVVGSTSANSEYISLIDQNFSSYLNTPAIINNITGTLEI